MKKAHKISRGIRDDFSFLIITNLIKAPATPMAIISFMNQVSWKMNISSTITPAAKITAKASVTTLKRKRQIDMIS